MVRLTDIIINEKNNELERERGRKRDSIPPKSTIRFRDMPSLEKSGMKPIDTQNPGMDDGIDAQPSMGTKGMVNRVAEKGSTVEGKIERLYENAYNYTEYIASVAVNGEKINIDEGIRIIIKIVDNLDHIDILYSKAIYTKEVFDPFISHPVNVAIYAIKVGNGLRYNKKQLVKLGIGALFHDLGMNKIPKEIINRGGELTKGEFELIKKHPQFGYELLLTLGNEYGWLAEISLQEHEREGGQGYPRGLKGDRINEYAKIIGIVDIYEALTHSRPQRKRLLPYKAVGEIIESYRSFFPPKIVKALVTQLSVFPLHSFVRLNSNAIGKVVKTSINHPLRPTVRILCDSQGRRIRKRDIIRLQDFPLLYIKDSLFEEDIFK